MSKRKTDHTTRMLRWVYDHGGWWQLICTPGDERMTFTMMKLLVEKLSKAELHELIFVMLMVHRDAPLMENVREYLLLERLVKDWHADQEEIVEELKRLLT